MREKPTIPQLEHQFGERVATIETELGSFKTEVRGELQALSSNVNKLADALNRQSRPNWQNWIGVIGLIFILVSGGIVFVDMRIEGQVSPLSASLTDRLIEVETQFNADDQLHNVQWSTQQRLNAELWNASKLGAITPYPFAPYFQPNIARRPQE